MAHGVKKPARAVRVIQQMEAAECGVACLAMVLSAYGHACPLWELRDVCGTSRDGNSAFQLIAAARKLGLEARGISLRADRLGTLQLPAILHWNRCHFVVLERLRQRTLTIVDPSNGRRELPLAQVEREFSGVALELGPGPDLEPRRDRSPSLGRYVSLLREQRRLFGFVLLGTALWQLLALATPGTQQLLIDHVLAASRPHWLLPVILALLAITLSRIILGRVHGVGGVVLHALLQFRLTAELGRTLLHLPLPYIESRDHGDLLGRVHSQAEVRELMARVVSGAFDLLLVTFLVALMLAYDPSLGALCLALLGLRVLVVQVLRQPVRQQVTAELTARGAELAALTDATTAIELLKGLGVERGMVNRYANRVRVRVQWSVASGQLQQLAARALGLLGAAMHAAILWFGGSKVIAGQMTVGIYIGFLAIWVMLESPLLSLVDLAEGWARVRGLLERCDDIFGLPSVKQGTHVPSAPVRGRIEVKNLGFRYSSGSPWILRNVDFTITPGEHVCLVGASGQGKSTLGALLCGLLRPNEGEVLLDGTNVLDYCPAALARHWGVALQTPVIFEGSVNDNLRVRQPDCPAEEVRAAADLAELHSVIQRLPGHYAGTLEAMGRNLSGGERQRVALAQALLGKPAVLLLDEATSALDRDLEQRILEKIAGLGSTIVSIAHRSVVIERADRVLEVQGGSVVIVAAQTRADAQSRRALCRGREEASWPAS